MAEKKGPDAFFPYEKTECPYVREMTDYWFSLKTEENLPLIGDFDTVEFPQHTPWMVLTDILDNGADFRVRLVGTKAVRVLGGDITGKLLSEGKRDYVEGRLAYIYAQAISTNGPVWGGGQVGTQEGRVGFYSEACILPLVDASGTFVRIVHMVRLRMEDGEWLT